MKRDLFIRDLTLKRRSMMKSPLFPPPVSELGWWSYGSSHFHHLTEVQQLTTFLRETLSLRQHSQFSCILISDKWRALIQFYVYSCRKYSPVRQLWESPRDGIASERNRRYSGRKFKKKKINDKLVLTNLFLSLYMRRERFRPNFSST